MDLIEFTTWYQILVFRHRARRAVARAEAIWPRWEATGDPDLAQRIDDANEEAVSWARRADRREVALMSRPRFV